MRTKAAVAIALVMTAAPMMRGWAEVSIDSAAPEFSLTDHRGNPHALSEHRGKVVVLEWINFDCPFVKKHYETGNMPRLQREYAEKGVVWLSICSSAPGKQGHLANKAISKRLNDYKAKPAGYLIDADGTVGRLYGAKTTPHLFIVDQEGMLVYAGAIDDKPSTDKNDVAAAHNHVVAALDEILAEAPVSRKVTVPYGCSVKY
jgi:peroxiredoxin